MIGRPTFEELGTEIGQLVDEKNAAYGSSFAKCGEFMRLLYPAGIPPHKVENALLLVRIFDKQMRIATDEDALGESPFADIAGYGLLGARMHKEKQGTWQGIVSGPDVANSSKAQPASAEPLTNQPTTPSASEPAASETSQQPASSSPPPTAATASTAVADVYARGADQERLDRSEYPSLDYEEAAFQAREEQIPIRFTALHSNQLRFIALPQGGYERLPQ